MQAQLVFKADDLEQVAKTWVTGIIRQEFWHHEQTDAFRPLSPIWQPGEDEVADVRHKITVAPADEDLLSRNPVTAVLSQFGPCAQRTHIGASLRFGQVHRARPFARDQFWQVERLYCIRGVVFQRLDLTFGEERFDVQGKAGTRHHVIDRNSQGDRQPHAAKGRVGGHTDPTAAGDGTVASCIAGRRDNASVFEPGRFLVARAVEGGEHLAAKTGSFSQDGVHHLRR